VLAEAIMEAEVSELTGAAKGERAPDRRLTNRNGYRERRWDTRVGTIGLAIPKVRDGSYFPSLLEPRRRAERALLSVVQEAYVAGVSTRRVEDLVEALGVANLSRSEVSRMCAALDGEVAAFPSRSLEDERYPYLFLDATYVKVRDGGRVVSMAALVAVGVAHTGERRILGLELAPGNDEGNAWAGFLRGLVERGLSGVRLVISDAHRGLVVAIRETLLGAAWQRCRVHFTRNAQDLVPRGAAGMVASAIRSIFEQPDGFVETPSRSLDWVLIDEELHSFFNDEAREMSAFLYGRRLYELMVDYWPTAESDPSATPAMLDFARIWKDTPKIVFSRTLERVEWNNRLIRDDAAAEVARLKAQPGFDMDVGGPTTASTLMRLKLLETRTFGSGVVYLRYETVHPAG
jgi:dihydrofolate reductase